MGLRSLFHQNTTYNAADLRALIDALGPQVIDENGVVVKGLNVSYGSSHLTVAEGVGFATANASTTGHNFAVVNTTAVDAANYSGGSTTWAPQTGSTPRTDIVFIVVADKALDVVSNDVTTVHFSLGTTTLPDKTCIKLAEVTSANSVLTAINDMRRSVIPASKSTMPLPLCVVSRITTKSIPATAWTVLDFTGTDVVEIGGRLFDVNSNGGYDMHGTASQTAIYAPYSGWYEAGFRIQWAADSDTETRASSIRANDIDYYYLCQQAAQGGTYVSNQNGSMPIHLDANDWIQVLVYSGSATNLSSANAWLRMLYHD